MSNTLQCLRCHSPLKYFGVRYLHEGMNPFDSRVWTKQTLNRLAVDVYACPRCGKIEFFEDGVGDDLRGEPPAEEKRP